MRVTAIERRETHEGVELAADVDGFRLWYRVPHGTPIALRGDAFLAATLLPAMAEGGELTIDGAPVSPALLARCERIQDVLRSWNPRLRRVAVKAEAGAAERTDRCVGSFFSGGVDGSYTFLRHADEITHLVFLHGVDIQVDNDVLYRRALASNRRFAERFGKALVPMRTNIRRFSTPRGLPWAAVYCGSGLASAALALGPSRIYLAASVTYATLAPSGSHLLLDPLWSTETVEIVHDGAEADRPAKLREIARSPDALAILRVCWQDEDYNCGRCEKCLRTMLALRLLGVEAPTFPPLRSLGPLRRLRIHSDLYEISFMENLRLARESGDREAAAILRRILRRHRVKRLLRELDGELTGGRVRRAVRRLARLPDPLPSPWPCE